MVDIPDRYRTWTVGIDAGGTKGLLVARDLTGSEIRHTGIGASLTRDGLYATSDRLRKLIQVALTPYPSSRMGALAIGVSGAGRKSERVELEDHLFASLPTKLKPRRHCLSVVTDISIALDAALDVGSGIVVIVGTGSIAMARMPDGSSVRTGGWGRMLGDDGGGYALGRETLRAVAGALDAGESTRLSQEVTGALDASEIHALLRMVYSENLKFQDVPVACLLRVWRDGDSEASQIVEGQINLLTNDVIRLANRVRNMEIRKRVLLAGGLIQHDRYRKELSDRLGALLPGWSIEPSETEPVEGAVRLAVSLTERSR